MASRTVLAYRAGARAARLMPSWLAHRLPTWLAPLLVRLAGDRAAMLRRHIARVDPSLDDAALDRAVRRGFDSYARYYVESFRLPGTTPDALEAGIDVPDYRHISEALAQGNGCILALPHLGGWEWAGFWLTTARRHPTTVVVEALEPPELFDWFAELREEFGMRVVVADANAGAEVAAALARNDVVCLLCDRDVMGGGVEVEFFGETTMLPAGPAMLGLRSGAPVLPVGVYFEQDGRHFGWVRPPVPLERKGRFRADVIAGTRAIAEELEVLIRRAPDQWHLLQPNWPSDEDETAG